MSLSVFFISLCNTIVFQTRIFQTGILSFLTSIATLPPPPPPSYWVTLIPLVYCRSVIEVFFALNFIIQLLMYLSSGRVSFSLLKYFEQLWACLPSLVFFQSRIGRSQVLSENIMTMLVYSCACAKSPVERQHVLSWVQLHRNLFQCDLDQPYLMPCLLGGT